MKKLVWFFIYITFFILSLIYFAPKENIFYFAQKQLYRQGIAISTEVCNDGGFNLDIKDADILYSSIKFATIKDLDIFTLLIYNKIDAQNISLSPSVKNFIPANIRQLTITYHIFNPLKITIEGFGRIGKIDGYYSILQNKVHIFLQPSNFMKKNYQTSLRRLKKDQQGRLYYEQTLK